MLDLIALVPDHCLSVYFSYAVLKSLFIIKFFINYLHYFFCIFSAI